MCARRRPQANDAVMTQSQLLATSNSKNLNRKPAKWVARDVGPHQQRETACLSQYYVQAWVCLPANHISLETTRWATFSLSFTRTDPISEFSWYTVLYNHVYWVLVALISLSDSTVTITLA